MRGAGKYVAVYDVSDDKEREQVAKVLEGYGIRVQKSSFECVLARGSRLTLERRLTDLKLESGFVFLYRLQKSSNRIAIGSVPPNPLDDSNYAFVIGPEQCHRTLTSPPASNLRSIPVNHAGFLQKL